MSTLPAVPFFVSPLLRSLSLRRHALLPPCCAFSLLRLPLRLLLVAPSVAPSPYCVFRCAFSLLRLPLRLLLIAPSVAPSPYCAFRCAFSLLRLSSLLSTSPLSALPRTPLSSNVRSVARSLARSLALSLPRTLSPPLPPFSLALIKSVRVCSCLSACPLVYLAVCVPAFLPACLSACLSVCACVCACACFGHRDRGRLRPATLRDSGRVSGAFDQLPARHGPIGRAGRGRTGIYGVSPSPEGT